MHQATQASARTVAVLSTAYLESAYATAEWQAAWRSDPLGRARKLLVFRVADCPARGCWASS
ncbi:toll/interleukin-1 receptor domain-containing protein [Frankia sp. CiP1_Cm_nod1]